MDDNKALVTAIGIIVLGLIVALVVGLGYNTIKDDRRFDSDLQQCQDISPDGTYAVRGTHWQLVCEKPRYN